MWTANHQLVHRLAPALIDAFGSVLRLPATHELRKLSMHGWRGQPAYSGSRSCVFCVSTTSNVLFCFRTSQHTVKSEFCERIKSRFCFSQLSAHGSCLH